MRESIRWALILSALGHIAIQALSAWETGRWNGRQAGLIRVAGDNRLVGSPSLTGCYLAIVLPLAPGWLWPVFALGLWWASSGLAVVAVALTYLLMGGIAWITR
jgi:hypothetical protein